MMMGWGGGKSFEEKWGEKSEFFFCLDFERFLLSFERKKTNIFFLTSRRPRRAHVLHPDRPLVVLDHEDARQLVQARHVEALVELAHVARAVAEKVDRDAVGRLVAEDLTAVLDLEGGSQADRDPLADEGEAAEEAVLLGEHVHGAVVRCWDCCCGC